MLLAWGGGCADFKSYMKDRGNDFADCFKGDVGYGLGVGAHVRATELFSVGAGGGYMWKHGFKGRLCGNWTDLLLGWPASNVILAFDVMPDMFGGGTTFGNNGSDIIFAILLCIPINYASVGRLATQTGSDPPQFERDFFKGGFSTHSIVGVNILPLSGRGRRFGERDPGLYMCPPIEMLDIEVGVMAGGVGFHVGFSPGQFFDFLGGWFGLDIAKDDKWYKPAATPEAPESPPPAPSSLPPSAPSLPEVPAPVEK